MAEVNDDGVIDDVSFDIYDDDKTDDSTEDSPDEISYEQAIEWKKKAERLDKAERYIVEHKRKAKQSESSSSESGEFVTKAQLAIDKFLDKNPELNDYTKELESYSKKGLSLDEAKTLILNSDTARVNREKLNSLGLSDGESSKGGSTYSDSDLVALSKKNLGAYNKAMADIESGKATHKN